MVVIQYPFWGVCMKVISVLETMVPTFFIGVILKIFWLRWMNEPDVARGVNALAMQLEYDLMEARPPVRYHVFVTVLRARQLVGRERHWLSMLST